MRRLLLALALLMPITASAQVSSIYQPGGTLIETFTATGSESTKTFTVPSGYRGYQLRINMRSSKAASNNSDIYIQFNGDTTAANYLQQQLLANNATATASTLIGTVAGCLFATTAASAPAGAASHTVVDISGGSTFHHTALIRNGYRISAVAAGQAEYTDSCGWLNTAAITSITVRDNATNTWVAGTTISLYAF